jgi:hypothetical protein
MREIKIILSAKLCAVTVFYFVDVPSPQHCKSLALVLHCLRFLEHCKLSRQKLRQRFTPQLPLLHICDPAGVCGKKFTAMLFAPLALKGVKLGRVKTCGILRQHKQPWTTWFALFATNKNATTNNTNL